LRACVFLNWPKMVFIICFSGFEGSFLRHTCFCEQKQ
jgi:hypothetical protein